MVSEGARLAGLVRLGNRLEASASGGPEVATAVVDTARELPADGVVVWTVDALDRRLVAVRTDHADPALAAEVEALRAAGALDVDLAALPPDAPLRLAVRPGRVVHVPKVTADTDRTGLPPALADLLARDEVASLAVVPMRGTGSVVGVAAAVRGPAHAPFGEEDVSFLRIVARRAGMAADTAAALESVRERSTVLESVSDAIVAVDAHGVVDTWNQACETLYGVPAGQAVGRPLVDVVPHMVFAQGDLGTVLEALRAEGSWRGRIAQRSATGRSVEVEALASARRSREGDYLGFFSVMRDLSEVLAAQDRERRQTRFTEDLMDALDSPAAVLDARGAVVTANARWRTTAGERDVCVCGPVPPGESWTRHLRGGTAGTPDEGAAAAFADEVDDVLTGRRAVARLECRCVEMGGERATAVEVVRLQGEDGGALVVQSDVSWRRRLEDELTHRALHDDLTGLPNRAALMTRLEASLRRLDGDRMLAVLFIDLDGFKDINDGLGHAVGDQVLVAVARRLRQRCRSADVVARFGGDEFVIVLPVPEASRAVAMADRLIEVLGEPIVVGDAEVAPGASIGITVVDRPPDVPDPVGTLLRDADTAMYHAKERGRGRYEIYDTSLRTNIASRLELASALRRASMDAEFTLVYQSRRQCGTRQVSGVEALLRWRHPALGAVSPGDFVPIAERTGRIVHVGGWALRRALAQVAELPDRRLSVAVNVSPRQLTTPRFVETVDRALAASGLEPWRVTLEITEGALVDDPDAARTVLADLRNLGTTIALDDFGTGWSSMSYLRTLPVDILKIDRSFVADLATDPDACAVVSAVLNLGHGMGLIVVAEGVERADQLEILRDMGCDEYQGFIDGMPAELDVAVAPTPGA